MVLAEEDKEFIKILYLIIGDGLRKHVTITDKCLLVLL